MKNVTARIKYIYLKISNKGKATRKRPNSIVKVKLPNSNHSESATMGEIGSVSYVSDCIRLRPHRHSPLTLKVSMSGTLDLQNNTVKMDGSCTHNSSEEVDVVLTGYDLECIASTISV